MEIAGFNIIDLIVLAVLLLSGIFAFARGLVKEVLSIVSWVGAAFATFYGFYYVAAFTRRFIDSPMIADAVAGGGLFLVSLFALSFVSGLISNRVRESTVGSVDRTLGFVFGLVRGFVLISLAYLALSWALPPAEQPKWVRAAKTMPIMEQGAAFIAALAPSGGPAGGPNRPGTAAQDRTQPNSSPLNGPGGPGYRSEERREMDRLIQGTQ